MIKLIQQGDYELIETKRFNKILTLSEKGTYAWINVEGTGEILVSSHKRSLRADALKKHQTDYVLAVGKYRFYEVKDEPKLADTLHLELLTGKGNWQGYLLITGFPTEKDKSRIIPTKEIITKSSGSHALDLQ